MTEIEKVIHRLSNLKQYCKAEEDDGLCKGGVWFKDAEAIDFAIAALREKLEREKNEPLTIDELRKMDGQPVWCKEMGCWGIVEINPDGLWRGIPFIASVKPDTKWNIERRDLHCYRHPLNGQEPKEEQHGV